jgi:Leucine-rich repeat (LRR) protein
MKVDLVGRGLTSFQEVIELIGEDNLSELSYLYLHDNQLTSFEHFPDPSKLPKLTHLYLSNNQITSFKHFPNLPKLIYLRLENNQLTSFKHFPILPKLIYLSLENNQLTSFEHFPTHSKLPKLRVLDLQNNPIFQFHITLAHLRAISPIKLSLIRRRTLRGWIARYRSRTLCMLLELNEDSTLFEDFREGFLNY